MIGIKVCRGSSFPGQCLESDEDLNWGDDISEVLLTNEDVALERGRVEIDSVYTNRIDSSISISSRIYVAPGSFIGINDDGLIQNGMLKTIRLSLKKNDASFTTSTAMTIERNI